MRNMSLERIVLQVRAMKNPTQFFAVFSLIIIVLQTAEAAVKLGDIIPLCDPKDPQLNQCVKESAQKLFSHMREGVPDLGLQPFDPMIVPYMKMGNQDGAVYAVWEFNDTEHTGLADGIVEDATIDMDKNIWTISVMQPHYGMTGKYKVNGKVLVLPVNGHGVFNMTVTDIRLRVQLFLSKKTVNGKEYLNLDSTKYDITITPGHQFVEMDGQDEFDKLGDGQTFKKFIIENTDEIIYSMKNSVEDAHSKMLKKYLGKLFDEVPYNELFKNV